MAKARCEEGKGVEEEAKRKSGDKQKVRGKWKVKYTKLISVAHFVRFLASSLGEGERRRVGER